MGVLSGRVGCGGSAEEKQGGVEGEGDIGCKEILPFFALKKLNEPKITLSLSLFSIKTSLVVRY